MIATITTKKVGEEAAAEVAVATEETEAAATETLTIRRMQLPESTASDRLNIP